MKRVAMVLTAASLGMIVLGTGVAHGESDRGIVSWGIQVVVEESALDSLVAVAAGWLHSVGLKSDGTIVAWGWNEDSQCDVPAPNAAFVAVAAGSYHSLGLKSDGTIVAWGSNNAGQCNVPAPNAAFVAVAAGSYHSLGLKSDGTIVAWGRNSAGQCNVPAPNADFVMVSAGGYHSLGLKSDGTISAWGASGNVPAPNADFVAVAAGGLHSLALKSHGAIIAWGDNTYGQCDVPAPNADFVAVAAGEYHSLGLRIDGTIVAWGRNSAGQCSVPAPNADFVAVAGGWLHSLGLKSDGTVVAWGNNDFGQCNVPAPNADFVAVSGGWLHNLGLKSDGTVVAWGNNDFEQRNVPAPNADFVMVSAGGYHSLGLKSDGTISAWGASGNVPAPNADFVAVAGGGLHSLALKSHGAIIAWGDNTYGQCDVPAPNADFVAVAAGEYHSLGLRIDGTIVAWGRNSAGQCNVPAPNADFVAVAGGLLHSLGLKSDGTVVAWGNNDFGQCIVPVPNADFAAVAAGRYHSLGLKTDSSIVAWGYNGFGRCNVPQPNAGFMAVEGGHEHSLGIRGRPLEPPHCDAGGPYRGVVGGTLVFDGTGSSDPDGFIVTYRWDFGDGSTGNGPTPAHVYMPGGLFTVTLVVRDNTWLTSWCTTTAEIATEGPPHCNAGGPYVGCEGNPVEFDGTGSFDPDGVIVSYSWEFGDGGIGSGPMPSHAYASSGIFTIGLTVVDDDSLSSSCTTRADITEIIPPTCDAGGPYRSFVGGIIQFDGTASSDLCGMIISYEWEFGDGETATGPAPIHSYSASGIYTVTLTVRSDTGLSSLCTTSADIRIYGCADYSTFLHLGSAVPMPDHANDVTVRDQLAFVASGASGGLQVVDIADPHTPTIVGAVDTPGTAEALTVAGNYALVADGPSGGLQVVDVTDPAAPVIAGGIDTPGSAAGVATAGNYAYVADGLSGLQVIDISNPESPQIVGSADTPGTALGVAVFGNHVCVADGFPGLQLIDVSTPTSPAIVGSADTPGTALDVVVDGDHAVVADGATGGLVVVDISDPTAPVIVGSVDSPGSAERVTVAGVHAYVSDGPTSGLVIINISDPALPAILSNIDTPDSPRGIAVAERNAYVADGVTGLLVVAPVPSTPMPITGIAPTLHGAARAVAVSCPYAYVGEDEGNGGALEIIDVSDPSAPQSAGSVGLPDPTDVVVAGSYAYLTGTHYEFPEYATGSLSIVDVSDPHDPIRVGWYSQTSHWEYLRLAVAGDYAYVIKTHYPSPSLSLKIFDISNPSQPLPVGNELGGFCPPLYVAMRIVGSQTFALLADECSALDIWDVTDPAAPIFVGFIFLPGQALAIDIEGDYAYVAHRPHALSVIDVSNIFAPLVVATVDTWIVPSWGRDALDVVDHVAYIGGEAEPGLGGIQVVDVADPLNPRLIGNASTPDAIWSLAANSDQVYVAEWAARSTIVPAHCEATTAVASPPATAPLHGVRAIALHQNRPNPFNPSTRIAFELPEAAQVSLRIYDVAGRQIRDLIQENISAGAFEVEWDGRDGRGLEVGSGVYFYRLEVEGSTLTRKLVVTR